MRFVFLFLIALLSISLVAAPDPPLNLDLSLGGIYESASSSAGEGSSSAIRTNYERKTFHQLLSILGLTDNGENFLKAYTAIHLYKLDKGAHLDGMMYLDRVKSSLLLSWIQNYIEHNSQIVHDLNLDPYQITGEYAFSLGNPFHPTSAIDYIYFTPSKKYTVKPSGDTLGLSFWMFGKSIDHPNYHPFQALVLGNLEILVSQFIALKERAQAYYIAGYNNRARDPKWPIGN